MSRDPIDITNAVAAPKGGLEAGPHARRSRFFFLILLWSAECVALGYIAARVIKGDHPWN